MPKPICVGFLGAGGIAQSHAYALDALKYYYKDIPEIEKVVVASPTPSSREGFAERFGFQEAVAPDEIWGRDDINTLFIAGPNHTHTPQLLQATSMPNIERIYLEKPIAISQEEIDQLETLDTSNHGKFIMIGFQFLQKSSIRKAINHWHSGVFGDPIHFRIEYLHSSYLSPAYRIKKEDRLVPIPLNGAAVDLGSHALSMLTAFLGNHLIVQDAAASGFMDDVPENSDLCTTVLLEDLKTRAIGTMVASRVSAGTGDLMRAELWGRRGTILVDTSQPDLYRSFLPEDGWVTHHIYSDYMPDSVFPSDYTPSGWLRALVHNHYLFLGADPGISFVPDLAHGIVVQRLLQDIAEHILMV
ncbi:MAG: Gfo/Idh/MocA family oxidoreductase [Chloroflexota bacterium]|nr:Gfo/Idh/MocA family oxidoreductase [Chloroflexota bacterium]